MRFSRILNFFFLFIVIGLVGCITNKTSEKPLDQPPPKRLPEKQYIFNRRSIDQTCLNSLNESRHRLENVKGELIIPEIIREDISQHYPDHPTHRSYEYSFAMAGDSVRTVLSSSAFIADIASSALQNCDDAGKISFYLDQSDWVESYGWTSKGIIEFDCLEPGIDKGVPRWGQQYCL